MLIRKNKNVVDFQQHKESREKLVERLFSEHGDALRSFLRGRMGGSQDIEDVVQEVFARLSRMEGLDEKVTAEQSNSRAFIFTMANNHLIDQARHRIIVRQHQELEMGLTQEGSVTVGPEVINEERQKLEVIERALKGLPQLWREAFVLNRFKFLTYKEIAREMNISARTVEKYIARALEKIRKAVSRSTGEGS